ncbi:RadC family protein [Atopobacter phocae]|uniref:RadC family protein n=1 Tax=Atopobacter phocae TaxID=136492 RepID=UPI0004700621|nr:DNA repair protein RadC [Atopobacter phocae]
MNQLVSRIREFPVLEQPRERLLMLGPKALATHELLAILLRTGTKDKSVIELALNVLEKFGDLNRIRQASLSELQLIPGIGQVKAIELQAMMELGERIVYSEPIRGMTVKTAEDAGKHFIKMLSNAHQEKLVALFLNTKNQVLTEKIIFTGGLNSSIAHPREIFREAVKESAASLLIAHNHPSGDTTPSEADIMFTKRMVECGELMGIEVLDHLIIGGNQYVSLRRLHLM